MKYNSVVIIITNSVIQQYTSKDLSLSKQFDECSVYLIADNALKKKSHYIGYFLNNFLYLHSSPMNDLGFSNITYVDFVSGKGV